MPPWSACLPLLVMLACSDPRPSTVDAGGVPMPPDAVSETCQDNTDPSTVDFFGEACQAAPYPANTVCNIDDRGWCINSVCRPMCAATCPRCPGGVVRFAMAGACYCEPRP